MFYQQLSTIEEYSYLYELIDKLDLWFGTLPNSEKDKITASKVSIRFGIDYDIAESILEKCCELNILEKIFIIVCPDCGTYTETISKEQLYEKLSMKTFCLSCEEYQKIDSDDILIGYKLIKKPTNSPNKIKRLIDKKLNNKSKNKNSATLSDHINKNLEAVNSILYNPHPDELKELRNFKDNIDNNFKNTKEKGDALEDLVYYMLNLVKCFKATKEINTTTNQLDCCVRNTSGLTSHVLKATGTFFICECKNENKKPENSYFHKLSSIIEGTKQTVIFGIVFSYLPAPKTWNDLSNRVFLASERIIINIHYEDLRKLIDNNNNFLDLIEAKVLDIQIDSNKDLKDNEIFQSKISNS